MTNVANKDTLSDAQKAQMERRNRRMESNVEPTPKAGDLPKAEPVGLRTMLALGEEFKAYDYVYKVSAFPVRLLPEVGNLLFTVHPALFCYALSWDATEEEYDVDEAAKLFNKLYRSEGEEKKQIDGNQFAIDFVQVSIYLSEAQIDTMIEYVQKALKRTHPDVTTEEIEQWLDVPHFCDFLRVTFRVNSKMRDRF